MREIEDEKVYENNNYLENIPEIQSNEPIIQTVEPENFRTTGTNKRSMEKSIYSSKKFSATGGTGGLSQNLAKFKSPTKVLGDFQMVMINKAFIDF